MFATLRRRLAELFQPGRLNSDSEAELAFHVDLAVADKVARGSLHRRRAATRAWSWALRIPFERILQRPVRALHWSNSGESCGTQVACLVVPRARPPSPSLRWP